MNILGSVNLQIKNNEVTGCGGNAIQLTKGAANTFSATVTGNHAVQNLGGKDYFIGKEATKATIASFKDNCSGYPATTRFYFGTGDKLPAGNGACIKLARVTGVTGREYTGKAITPKPVVVLGTTLIEGTDYTLSYRDNVQVGTATVTITGKGQFHDSTSVKFKITEATVQDLSKATVTVADQSFDGKAKTPAPTVKLNGKVLQAGTDYTVKYSDNTDPGKAKLTITGKGLYKGTVTKTFTITKPKGSFVRIAGKNRYATAYDIGNQLKLDMKVIKYDNIVVADGRNYPDALAASYLAKVKKAPIVLTAPGVFDDTVAFIRKNMKTGGTVYIAGGPGSVPQEFVNKLAGIKVKRMGGANRYETNLLILKEAAVKNQDIIVCTGADFGDSLSAGATGRPILLAAGSSLTNSQKTYLNGLTTKKYYVIGGADVVSNGVQADLAKYGSVTRITGKDVFTRSVSIAKTFFPGNQPHVGLASGESYPDGLCGDPLAMAKGGPLLLAGSQKHMYSPAAAYAKAANTYQVTVFGGAVWVSDQAVRAVLGQ
ncbi:MAG: cell wall-binding repeat-containing protein, partial [Firmicutes bacterium]|nr:cell wall-binding repeat-containing protein [Bacillota bacterium]